MSVACHFPWSQADGVYIVCLEYPKLTSNFISWPLCSYIQLLPSCPLAFEHQVCIPFLKLCYPCSLLPSTTIIHLPASFLSHSLPWAPDISEPVQTESFSTCRTGASGQHYRNTPHLFSISSNWGVNNLGKPKDDCNNSKSKDIWHE